MTESQNPNTNAEADAPRPTRRKRRITTAPTKLRAALRTHSVERTSSLAVLRLELGIDTPLAEAIRIAHGWTNDTHLTPKQVEEARDQWLAAEANETYSKGIKK